MGTHFLLRTEHFSDKYVDENKTKTDLGARNSWDLKVYARTKLETKIDTTPTMHANALASNLAVGNGRY